MKRCLLLVLIVFSLAALAPSLPKGLKPLGAATVVAVVDGDTVRLDDGRQVRMVGTQAPKLPLGRKNFEAWPLGEEAKTALEKLALRRKVTLHGGGATEDRHGRVLAHLKRDDGLWLQGEMLRQGLARVYSFPDNRSVIAEMLALESEARAARRGIWRDPYYYIRSAETVRGRIGSYELVEGRPREANRVKTRVYLNYGLDWRSDFTVRIEPSARRELEKRGFNPADFKGRLLRVRGWVISENGPMIVVTHADQIEFL